MGEQTATTHSPPPAARYEPALFALAGAALLLSQLGYSFERGDQLQYLLLPYRGIYPSFLRGDWFTWHTTHYHHAFSWIVTTVHRLSGEAAFALAMLGTHVAVLLWLSYAVWRLSRGLGFGWLHAALALLVLAVVREVGLGGDTLNHAQLVPSDIALPPFLLACAAWLEQKQLRAGAWLGLSGLLHANFAVLGPLVLGLPEAWLCLRTRSARGLLALAVPYTLIALPTLALTAQGFLAHDAAPAAISIVLEVRSPHHYDLKAFPAQDLAWLLLLLVAGSPAWLTGRFHAGGERNRGLLAALVAVVLLGLCGSLLHITPLVRLFVWRLSIPILLIALLLVAESALQLWRARNRAGLPWLAGCAAAMATFVRDDLAQVAPFGVQGAWFALPALLPLLAGGVLLAKSARPRPWLLLALSALPVAWAGSIAHTPLAGAESAEDEALLARKLRGPRLGELLLHPKPGPLYDKVRALTPEGSTFLIPPSLIGFRLQARRAVYVDWKCVPMRGEEAAEWKRRMLAALGTEDFPVRGYQLRKGSGAVYAKRELRELAELARREHLDYVIASRNAKWKRDLGLEPAFVSGGWRIYRVLPLRP
jgi:hypothetical protein